MLKSLLYRRRLCFLVSYIFLVFIKKNAHFPFYVVFTIVLITLIWNQLYSSDTINFEQIFTKKSPCAATEAPFRPYLNGSSVKTLNSGFFPDSRSSKSKIRTSLESWPTATRNLFWLLGRLLLLMSENWPDRPKLKQISGQL